MKPDAPHGVLVVDKPPGMTSHDVVARARRALMTRAVGHAGTLDPMATGVLVLAIGEATKLVPWLTASDKTYEATVQLGVATDSLDADGVEVGREPIPDLSLALVDSAARSFLGPHVQQAPAVSAIKVDGVRLHARARRGEAVEPPHRDVVLHEVEILAVRADAFDLWLRCAKGFYVRSFARDLARRLGTVGHLSALRRTMSGHFEVMQALPASEIARDRLLPLVDAVRQLLPTCELDETQAADARCGRRILGLEVEGDVALLYQGHLVAVARAEEGAFRVVRGFAPV